ncbi:hypothetical protein [Rhodanobacter lindaniclasticus]|nr:hypothetical protein [Rhodanobacter lindaniclasticus]
MSEQEDIDSVLEALFGDSLTEGEIEAFKSTLSTSGATAEALGAYLEKAVGVKELEAVQFGDMARKWELAASKYAQRMNALDRAPAGVSSLFQQAQLNFQLARESEAIGDSIKAVSLLSEGIGKMLGAIEFGINLDQGLSHNDANEFYGGRFQGPRAT